MKKKSPKNIDVGQTMLQIQEQLAALDQKLEAFINKSLIDIAQALAAQKTAIAPRPVSTQSAPIRHHEPHRRPMFAVVCFQCGKDCEIPFKPAPGRPVYCPECFAKRKANHAAAVNPPNPPVAVQPPAPPVKEKKKVPLAQKPATKKKTAAKRKK